MMVIRRSLLVTFIVGSMSLPAFSHGVHLDDEDYFSIEDALEELRLIELGITVPNAPKILELLPLKNGEDHDEK